MELMKKKAKIREMQDKLYRKVSQKKRENGYEIIETIQNGKKFIQKRKIAQIPQSNNYDIIFNWNGEEYELVLDASFWIQPYPVESFINKLSQHYANDVIITESQKIGFQPVKSKQHVDGSNTITLQRWNLKNSVSVL